jgi:hypothetical protein
MADLNKFEKMLELLVNEDKEAAQELFHEIVVEKSRDIYESLLEDDEEVDESDDEEVDESDEDLDEADDEEVDESDEDLDENFSLDTFEVEADDEEADDAGDEEADDMDMGDEEEEGEEGEGDVEDRVEDLEDALDDLKAEFEKMMAGDDEGDDEDEEGDDDMGGDATDDMMGDLGMDTEEAAEEDESFQATITPLESKAAMSAGEQMREYVEKVSATMGDNGSDTKSTVAGKNDMGGTTANLRGGESKGEGTQGGLAAPTAKDMNTKNVNVPGAKGATKMASQPGHGAEKKGKPETADKSASSMLNGAPKRAK